MLVRTCRSPPSVLLKWSAAAWESINWGAEAVAEHGDLSALVGQSVLCMPMCMACPYVDVCHLECMVYLHAAPWVLPQQRAEGQRLATLARAKIIAPPSTLSWHDALPRLMLSEVIVVEPHPDKNCSDWARFLLTPTSLMAVWQLSWITHVRLGNMQHILEPPILEHSVLGKARPDVAYTHLEGCSCQRTRCPDPHATYKSIMEIFRGVPLSATWFVFDSTAFPYWSPGITRGSLAETGLGAKSKFIFHGGWYNPKKSISMPPGDHLFPRGLLACTVTRALFLQDPRLALQQSSRGRQKEERGRTQGAEWRGS